MPRNRPWSREELILALDLYFKIGASYKTHPDVIELSEVLNRLSDSAGESDATRFRNPSGVAMKLGNFARLDRNYSGAGLTHGNKLEPIFWDEFSSNREQLVIVANEIRQGHQAVGLIDGSLGASAIERGFYALSANPDKYRIEDAVAELPFDDWLVGRSWLQPGDRVLVWKSYGRLGRAARRGIVGFGEVVDFPATRAAPNKYWTDPDIGHVEAPRVTIKYVGMPNLPLWEDETPELADLTVSGGQGTVFKVSHEQFNLVVNLAGGWPEQSDEDDGFIVFQKTNKADGQGFPVCQNCKQAIELRAMELAIEYYTQAGYSVTDVSGHQPFDLACVISGVNHHVEVKGTTGDGEKILLTPNEVEHARNYSPVALFIVNAISLSHSLGDDCRAAGGSLICRQPWDISKGELVAVGYSYEPEPCY